MKKELPEKLKEKEQWLIKKAVELVEYEFDKKVNTDLLPTRKRNIEICFIRYIVWYILKLYTNLSLKYIGSIFDKDHATVLHGGKALRDYIFQNANFREQLRTLEKEYLHLFGNLKIDHRSKQLLSNELFYSAHRSNQDIGRLLVCH